MITIFTLLLIVCGLLAAANLILAKRPDAKQIIDKVIPYSGFMGVALLVLAIIYMVRDMLPNLSALLSIFNGWIALATLIVAILLGFLLSYGLLSKMMGDRSPAAREKGEQLRAKLASIQAPLGIAGVALGIYSLV